jgi:hypothetical protein
MSCLALRCNKMKHFVMCEINARSRVLAGIIGSWVLTLVVSVYLFSFALFGFYYTQNLAQHEVTGKGGFVRLNQDIQRISVSANCRRDKTKFEGERKAVGQGFVQPKHRIFFVVFIFDASVLGGLHNDVECTGCFIERRQPAQISRFHVWVTFQTMRSAPTISGDGAQDHPAEYRRLHAAAFCTAATKA